MDLQSVTNYDEVKNAIMEKVVHPSFHLLIISAELRHLFVT